MVGSNSIEGVHFIQIESDRTKLNEWNQNVYLQNAYTGFIHNFEK